METWKDIEGYEGIYQVSSFGRVISMPRKVNNRWGYFISKQKNIKPRISKCGYGFVALYKNNKRKDVRIHRLVANAFLNNLNCYPIINHKDGNKMNNNVENLEWCSYSQNTNHAIENNLIRFYKGSQNKKARKIAQCDLNGNVVKVWFGVRDVARQTGYSYGNIDQCIRNKRKTAYGYVWRVANERL